jgi:methionyl-tRNA formyltransferase
VEKVRDPAFLAELAALEVDVSVVVAFGQIFRRPLLELPRLGSINVHASLLPRYRGAAPIQAAIAAGDTRTGVTTMQMDVGLDSGPILLTSELAIRDGETTAELAPRLAEHGATLLVETLAQLEAGTLPSTPQDDSEATYAPRLSKADAVVDWELSATEIYDRLRALTPWPGLVSKLREQPLKILSATPLTDDENSTHPPGTLAGMQDGRLVVHCGGGGATIRGVTRLGLERVQRPGKKGVSVADFVNAEHVEADERFSRFPAAIL